MGNYLLKFNDKSFTLHTLRSSSRHLKKVASGIRKNHVKYFPMAYIKNMGMKGLLKLLKVAL